MVDRISYSSVRTGFRDLIEKRRNQNYGYFKPARIEGQKYVFHDQYIGFVPPCSVEDFYNDLTQKGSDERCWFGSPGDSMPYGA